MFDAQMEMSFGEAVRFGTRRQRRLTRAQWWFQRMRQVVERTTDWQPAPAFRPEQIWLAGGEGRLGSAAPAKAAEERQICE